MDLELFRQILSMDSTSGKEAAVADFLLEHLDAPSKQAFEVGDGTRNLLFQWGEPKVVFCSHMDTVPPYIGPDFREDGVWGRGSCDAKGQVFCMYSACKILEARGCSGFGLLLLSGEETGSWGAKAFARLPFRADVLVIGEPTDNCMVRNCKGTKSFDLVFKGEAFHSGYPQFGRSAVEMFVDFVQGLREQGFNYNVGLLKSENPQNILSPELSCRIYFRTTAQDDAAVVEWMGRDYENISISARGGDSPAEYLALEGFDSKDVAFGSDAPHLSNFQRKAICGPGSITVAHRDDEHILYSDMEKAVDNYCRMFETLTR
ncbi:MAG: M20/M25/M40 family metallo-hydrolase [Bacteroidales bacterium]|nr:M20/M25/M40 family metallo-hydrolase [Candidatus Cryptobacteroides equifaecalis]